MKVRMLFLSLSTSVLWTASAQTSIAIVNPYFIDDQVSCSPGQTCGTAGVSGWICGPVTGLQVFSKTQYPSAPDSGLYAAYLGDGLGAGNGTGASGSIFQTLGATVQANTTYVLKVEVGARADYEFTGYKAALLAGNVRLVEGHSATPIGGRFVIDAVVYRSGPNPAQLGQPLQIYIKSQGLGQADIRAVSLTAE